MRSGTKSSALPFLEETLNSRAADRRAFQVGPLIERQRVGLRYGSAIGLLLTVALARFALIPLLGSQAPLLPFIVAVLAAAYIGGRGPALLACLLTPPVATVLFTHWPQGSNPGPWSAHLAFFVAIGVIATLIVDQLQRSYAAQQDALLAAQESEHKANTSEARLRLVADSLPLLVAYVDRDLRYRFHNSRYFEWLGREAGAVLGRHIREVLGEEFFQQRSVQFEAALRGETVRFETQQPHATLGSRACEVTYVPDQAADGTIRGFYVMGQDITERVKAERALQESERMLKLIYDSSSDAIYLAQLEPPDRFRFISVNQTFLTVSGYSREQAEGRLVEDILPPASHTLVRAKYREAIESRGPVVYQEVADLPAGRKHGEITLIPIVGRDDSVTHILAAIKDLTAQEHAMAVARLARQESARLGVLKEEFLTTVNHELRTPLHAILTWTSLLRRGDLPAADQQRGLESIERNARLQTLTVSDLLDMSGILSGKLRLKMAPLEVRTALTAAMDAVRPAALAKNIELLESLDGSAALVMGDADRLQQVFWNLLSNALKFTDSGGRVQVTLQQQNSQIRISFEDSGKGIAAEFLPHVFDRFRQADGSLSRGYGGMGLGLAIVRGVVEMHGGSVEATSPGPGRGATFIVVFPVSASGR
jgi:PAS domain S-box-containing protein